MKRTVEVSIADAKLARTMRRAIDASMRAAIEAAQRRVEEMGELRVVRLRARRALASTLATSPDGTLGGALAIVRVTERNARHLPELVEGLRAANASAVQMVWDGTTPTRSLVERWVFEVLERARGTSKGPPVILARTDDIPFALRILVANRHPKDASS